MKVFICTDFTGHYPVGVGAVIIAPDQATARQLLVKSLRERGLGQDNPAEYTLTWEPLTVERAIILCDGNY